MDAIQNRINLGRAAGPGMLGSSASTTPASSAAEGGSFADLLRNSIDEVSRLQKDASSAVEALATGQTEDVTGVLTAMEKSDVAFKTLLAIRGKLMDAYDEIRNIQI